MDLKTLLTQNLGIGWDRRLALADQIGGWSWNLDVTKGILTLQDPKSDRTRTTPVQLLGSESKLSATWMWAWANTSVPLAERTLDVAHKLRELGQTHQIPELTGAEVPLTRIDGARVGMVASGLDGLPGFFRGPYTDGAIFMLLEDPTLLQAPENLARRVFKTFNLLLNTGIVHDHRATLEAYLGHLGIELTRSDANGFEARSPIGETLVAKFVHGKLVAGKTFPPGMAPF